MFDYEWATVQHTVNCRLAQAVVVPEAIPPERLDRLRRGGKLGRYPGLKEGVLPGRLRARRAVLDELGLARDAPFAVVRTPPGGLALPPLRERPLRRGAAPLRDHALPCRPSSCRARTSSAPSSPRAGGFIVPERAIDAQSLIAFADVVVSAGRTMNREAVALGTPVSRRSRAAWGGRRGLSPPGRLRRLDDPRRAHGKRRGTHAVERVGGTRAARRSSLRAAPADPSIGALNCPGCADARARRRSASTATRSPSSRSTGRWRRSPTSSPTGCGSTVRRRPGAHDRLFTRRCPGPSCWRSSSSRCSGSSRSSGATPASATTSRSCRPWSSRRSRSRASSPWSNR